MKLLRLLIVTTLIAVVIPAFAQKEKDRSLERANPRVDNNGYWKKMAEKGLTTLNPVTDVAPAKYTGSEIDAFSSVTDDSPDVPVTTESSTQSENSIFINPNDPENVLNSNNSTGNPYPPLYGANDLYSFDGGTTWMGEIEGAGGDNSGDPAVVIGNNGWYYVNYIASSYGQTVSWSDDQGISWNPVVIDNGGGAILDKNHFWIDNAPGSPYDGNLYCAWTDFGGVNNNDIELSYSDDQGVTFSSAVDISSAVGAGSHCQGVNINTGPNGEVYAVFAVYDGASLDDENAYGLARSLDGGASWDPATRIIENTRGIRVSETSKNMRCNSFPVLAVDISDGSYSGNLYMVWTNIGEPGVNTGDDIDIYMIRSTDQGDTWGAPIRVNQDDAGLGHEHYFPWITCDPTTGTLSVVFYDDRNVGGNECEVFCANSFDGGDTWEDFKVSDISFTPSPIPGLAGGYMGDYLGIAARDSYVYPCWTDNRTGTTMTYVSPYQTNNLSRPYDLTAILTEETGEVALEWNYDIAPGFSYFILYREGVEFAQTTDMTYGDQLPDYGIYQYKVTAFYAVDGESTPASASIQWGDAHIYVTPDALNQTLLPDSTAIQYLTINNIGELDLSYDISTFILTDKGSKAYCDASGEGDEYISQVEFGDINNTSGEDDYTDYTAMSTTIKTGESIPITITNGNAWDTDIVGIWIDWNQNEDFTDDDPISVSGGPDTFTANITAPDDAVGGTTRMRVRMQYGGTPEPCGTTTYGEVEDYGINVISWLSSTPKAGTILPGESMQVEVTFDATDLALGVYEAEFSVSSNDPDLPTVVVPVTLTVSENGVTATATPDGVCLGEEVQLHAQGFGGLGSYAYSWTSDPVGFTSTLQDPLVTPLVNTIYYVEAGDGTFIANAEVSVLVHELPEVMLGADTAICEGMSVTFDAGPGFKTYEWQDGSDAQTFTATESGVYSVEVTTDFDCPGGDEVFLTVNTVTDTPSNPSGPSMADYYETTQTSYSTTDFPDALAYTWELSPFEAGMITNNGPDISIEWSADYIGETSLKVMTTNDCGDSPWSDTIHITLKNTTGIHELEQSLNMQVYPNPNKGDFKITFNAEKEMYVNIGIYNQLGASVYRLENLHLKSATTQDFNLGNLPAGNYSLSIETDEGKVSRQLLIQR